MSFFADSGGKKFPITHMGNYYYGSAIHLMPSSHRVFFTKIEMLPTFRHFIMGVWIKKFSTQIKIGNR
jgi:hypothetical protein